MSLATWILLAYCILGLSTRFFVHATSCFTCASPSLKENWELTGLPAAPTNTSIFGVEDCTVTKNVPKLPCSGSTGCFFGTFASISGEYLVVRGCVDEFLGDSGLTPNSAASNCLYAPVNRPVSIDGETANSPLVGWYTCVGEDNCNNMIVDHELITKPSKWSINNKPCEEPQAKPNCVSCQHFDGVGRCHHNSKTTCQGNYCTKLVGKLDGRWFEIRGCTQMVPFGLPTCIGYKKKLVIEQLGTVMNQTYWSTNCVCEGDRCNSASKLLAKALPMVGFACAILLFKVML